MRKKAGSIIAAVLTASILFSGFDQIEVKAAGENQTEEIQEQSVIPVIKKRVRPVKKGESLTGIARDVYGDSSKAELLYEVNKSMIGEDSDYLQADTYLVLPEIPSEQMEWEELYERTGQEDKENYYEWDIYDTWCKETVSYRIEEHYFYKDPLDKDYGKWEASEETMDICYPQIVFKDGRDAALINIAIRNCAMDSAYFLYLDPSKELLDRCKNDERFDLSWLVSRVHYQITYMDDHLFSVTFQDAYFSGSIYTESYELRAVTINLDTGHVYTRDELFANKEQLAEKVHDILQSEYTEEDSHYLVYEEIMDTELFRQLLETERWIDGRYKGVMFLDKKGINIGVTFRVGNDGFLWRGYRTAPFTPEEIAEYQSDSEFFEIWKPNLL